MLAKVKHLKNFENFENGLSDTLQPYFLYGSTYFIKDSRRSMLRMLRVSSQGIWKILELFGFSQTSMLYDVDFSVDVSRKKFPDEQNESEEVIVKQSLSRIEDSILKIADFDEFLLCFTNKATYQQLYYSSMAGFFLQLQ